jgi:hypothetical protein
MTYSNVVSTDNNPAYTADTFLAEYPQFTDNVPDAMITRYIAMAQATIAYDRWFELWEYGMGLYTAHLCTIYLQTVGAAGESAEDAAAYGQTAGAITSMKEGDVSVAFDHDALTKGTEAWGMWNSTSYGRLLVSHARLLGKGGSFVI